MNFYNQFFGFLTGLVIGGYAIIVWLVWREWRVRPPESG